MTLEREIARLTAAIAAGGNLPSLLEGLTVRQTRLDELVATAAVREELLEGRRSTGRSLRAPSGGTLSAGARC